ncbi:MAG: MoaD/ThiS family protein [Anaerolineae bacterium]|nr:MoaD/ThiS family protein [Anaerolineae bacterium]
MPSVKFTKHLKRFFPDLRAVEAVEARTAAEVVAALEARHPGLGSYIVDERGALRQHVNIFIGDALIFDRERLSDPVGPDDRVYIFQALSGG